MVRVRSTNPFAISAAEGVYVALRLILLGLNTPAPPDQIPPLAPVLLPFNKGCGVD